MSDFVKIESRPAGCTTVRSICILTLFRGVTDVSVLLTLIDVCRPQQVRENQNQILSEKLKEESKLKLIFKFKCTLQIF